MTAESVRVAAGSSGNTWGAWTQILEPREEWFAVLWKISRIGRGPAEAELVMRDEKGRDERLLSITIAGSEESTVPMIVPAGSRVLGRAARSDVFVVVDTVMALRGP